MIEITSQVDIKSVNFSVQAHHAIHNRHDPKTSHSNKQIDFDFQDWCWTERLGSRDDELSYWFGDEIKAHNLKLKSQLADGKISKARYQERLVKSAHDYLKKKKPLADLVVGLGNRKKWLELFDKFEVPYSVDASGNPKVLDKEKVKALYGPMHSALEEVVLELTYKDGFEPLSVSYHFDELPPHAHISALKLGEKTKSGKQSVSLNSAISRFLGADSTGDNRKNLSLFNHTLAQAMTTEFEKSLAEEVKLVRTGAESGLSMSAHQALLDRQRELDEREAELDAKTKALAPVAELYDLLTSSSSGLKTEAELKGQVLKSSLNQARKQKTLRQVKKESDELSL